MKFLTALTCMSLSMAPLCVSAAAMQIAAGSTGSLPSAGTRQVLLYDQTDNASSNGAPDQDFEAAFDLYDSEGADDFVVTDPSGWTVEEINTVGTTGTPGSATTNVTFYTNAAGGGNPDLPGSAVPGCSYTGIVPTDNSGSFNIVLPTPCYLTQGTYWVAIQTRQDFNTNGQHFWSNRSVQSNSESVWRNPNDGFARGCINFAPQASVCNVGGGASPDFLFQVLGQVGGLAMTGDQSVPVFSLGGLLWLSVLLGGGGLLAMRKRS